MIKNINSKNVFYLGITGMIFSVLVTYFRLMFGAGMYFFMLETKLSHSANANQEPNLFQIIIFFVIILLAIPLGFLSILFLLSCFIAPFLSLFYFFKWLLEGKLRLFKVFKMHLLYLLLFSPLFLIICALIATEKHFISALFASEFICLIIFSISLISVSFNDKLERSAFDDNRKTFIDIFSLKVLRSLKFVEGIRFSFFLSVLMSFLLSLAPQELFLLSVEKVRLQFLRVQFLELALFSFAFLLISVLVMLMVGLTGPSQSLDFYVIKKEGPFFRNLWIFGRFVFFCLLSLAGFLLFLLPSDLLLIILYLICLFSIIIYTSIFYFYGSLCLAFSGYFTMNILAVQILLITGNPFASLISLLFVFLPFILHSFFGEKENQGELLEKSIIKG